MKKTGLILALLLLAALPGARPAEGQTFLLQVFPESDRIFGFDVTVESQVALTVMWNRQVSTLIAVMVCEIDGQVFDWAASAPLQDRAIRMDVGVIPDLFCVVNVSTDLTAAFAINLQSFEAGNLLSLATTGQVGEPAAPIRLREAKDLDPEKLALLRPELEAARDRLRKAARGAKLRP